MVIPARAIKPKIETMGRQIKFRAWIPRLEMMLYGITLYADGMIGIGIEDFEIALKSKNPKWKLCDDMIYFSDDEHFDPVMSILPGDEWIWIEADNCEVMEFAGIYAGKNEVYEKDILMLQYPIRDIEGDDSTYILINVVIDFHGGAFWFSGDGYTDCNWHFYNSPDRKIIGNTFENPELISPAKV